MSYSWKIKSILVFTHSILLIYLIKIFQSGGFEPNWYIIGFCMWILLGKIGGEIGFHRYFAHRSFATSPFFDWCFYFLGSLIGLGSPLSWIAVHRTHHLHADTNKDPHSPKNLSALKVWMTCWGNIKIDPMLIKDVYRSRRHRWMHNYYFYFILIWIVGMSTLGFEYLVFLFAVPNILTFHTAGLVDSACHMHGYRNFETNDSSYNNIWVHILTLGGGLHNNHHRFPNSYNYSIKWFEFDYLGLLIRHLFKS